MRFSTVILKPTKHCNAECSYCAAPPEVNGAERWDVDRFRRILDKLLPSLQGQAIFLWHGGEPMLMGPDFYERCAEHARAALPGVEFAMQTNLLLYSTKRWSSTFRDVFRGHVSTSYDPDEGHREYKTSTALYARMFHQRLEWALGDGFRPMVLGTYTDDTAHMADGIYERALSWGDRAPPIRFNYRFPAGRDAGKGVAITPENYAAMLLRIYDRWLVDAPPFAVTPLDNMMRRVLGSSGQQCPWLKGCAGRFLAIEPNGDVYNCASFADLGDEAFRFGNIDVHDAAQLMSSPAAVAMRRRRHDVPADCVTCRHFDACEGGCMRDSVLFGRGLAGKFFYCASWKAVFDRIKSSIASGEADGVMPMVLGGGRQYADPMAPVAAEELAA